MSALETEPVDGTGMELESRQVSNTTTIFGTDDPMEIMARTAEVAQALKEFVRAQGLVARISGRDYIVVEGWQMLGMMLGVTPAKVKTEPVDSGWSAIAELHDRNGRVVGEGEAECLETERTWKSREDYARKSMAQTRAVGKAYRNTFGFIAKAAGYEPVTAEEAPEGQRDRPAQAPDALPDHATGEEAEKVDLENRALLDELVNTYGMTQAKADALYDGYRTLDEKHALTVRLGKLIEARQVQT